jgi:hypothetical protein
MKKPRNTNNFADDEFGFDYDMSEVEFNKRHRKALKDADPSYIEKKPKSKKKKNSYVQDRPLFRGLGSSSRGPGHR